MVLLEGMDFMTEKVEKESISLLFGQNVKKYRKQMGLTQEQLSEKLGISQKHLSIIETGTQFASASLIGRISKELKVSPGDLFGGSSDEVLNEIKMMREVIVSMLMNGIMGEFSTLDATLDDIRRLLESKNA